MAKAAEGGFGLTELRKMVDTAAEMTEEARRASEKSRDYYDSHQLTEIEKAILKKRKQPELTINRIKRKIDAMVGIEQKGRVDPRALPRNPQDEDAADIATKALVFVEDITRFDMLRSAFCYNLAVEGYGGVEVNVKARNGQNDPDLVRLRWEEIFFDPYSRELDFSDAGYVGVQKWMTLDRAMEFAKGYSSELDDETLEAMLTESMEGTTGDTYDDRPKHQTSSWGDKKKKRVKLAYMYYRCEGTWYLSLICGGGVIYNEVSPFLDYTNKPEGEPECAIILQACYIDRENRRYGIVPDMIPMQDEINARRSKLLHQLNSRQTMGAKGAVADVKLMKRELAQPDGHVEYEQDPLATVPSFQIVPQTDQIAGQFQLLQESKGEIDMLGPNPSLLGQQEGQQSGRAIIAQQQAGMAELAPFYDNLRDWTLRVYRAMWNRIRQFWTEPRWIRVTDEQEKLQFIGINQPMQQPDPFTGQMVPAVGPDGQPVIDNEVGALDVDIIIDMTPEYASLQQEEFNALVELAKSGMVQIPPDVLIEASQLRNKGKLIEKMNGGPEAADMAQQQQMMAQQAMQAQLGELMAKVEKLTAEAQNKQADTELKIAQTEQIRQETMLEPVKLQHEVAAQQDAHGLERERFGEEAQRGRRSEDREDARFGEDQRNSRVAESREGLQQSEDIRSGRVNEAREGARMAEEFRSGRTSEQMAQEKQAADIEIARRQAANPPARG